MSISGVYGFFSQEEEIDVDIEIDKGKNAALAHKICKLVNECLISENNSESLVLRRHIEEIKQAPGFAPTDVKAFIDALEVSMEKMRDLTEIIEDYIDLDEADSQTKLNYRIVEGEFAQTCGVGNCDEMSALGLALALANEEDAPERIEMFEIENGDHVFLVIGRAFGSDPNDPSTWGESAIICDPWANAVYPASEFNEKMRDCGDATRDEKTHEIITIFIPYNKEEHVLCPMAEFAATQSSAADFSGCILA